MIYNKYNKCLEKCCQHVLIWKGWFSSSDTFKYNMLHCFQQERLWSREMNISFITTLKNDLSKLLWFFILHVSFGMAFHRNVQLART